MKLVIEGTKEEISEMMCNINSHSVKADKRPFDCKRMRRDIETWDNFEIIDEGKIEDFLRQKYEKKISSNFIRLALQTVRLKNAPNSIEKN